VNAHLKNVEANPSGLTSPALVPAQGTAIDSFLPRTCATCEREIRVEQGDILFGRQWYHPVCWELAKQLVRTPETEHDAQAGADLGDSLRLPSILTRLARPSESTNPPSF